MKRLPGLLRLGFAIFFIAPVSTERAFPQEFRATLLGKVTDQKEAVLPGVTIEIANLESGETRLTETDTSGNYNVPFLNPGAYRISAHLSGFKQLVREGIQLNINDRITVDLKLEIGGLTETVTVVAETPMIDSDSANAGTVMNNKQVNEYPLNGRNIFMLLDVSPGVGPEFKDGPQRSRFHEPVHRIG